MRAFVASHPGFRYCVEVTEAWIRSASGVGSAELIGFFGDHGFAPHTLTSRGRVLPFKSRRVEGQQDLVFLRRDEPGLLTAAPNPGWPFGLDRTGGVIGEGLGRPDGCPVRRVGPENPARRARSRSRP